MTAPYPPSAAGANDKTTLWGVLGIVFSLCCPLLGIVFSVLSMMEAKKVQKQPTLAYVGFAVAAVVIIGGIILNVTGAIAGFNSN
ncbi:hypothetical protein GCM10010124_03720 [Pilimelia terevasa]|uniref:DUF4190 domain-containing protein n=1 Tax=Pilimelia terevasa TaxID=53372 RepID=A0A8J3FEJ8_9ACTN|nr:hypothetical protein [Pilimelia terevasa]GGK14454.1 hypothetical protein GCM10010124_03720 [Pilimelia terevasa]